MKRPNRPASLFIAVTVMVLCAIGYSVLDNSNGQTHGNKSNSRNLTLADIPFDGRRAYRMLENICDLGPRPSGSTGMHEQQELLTDHFSSLGGKVIRQSFRIRHPVDGSQVIMTNLIVQWHPEREKRILLCAHYDTRPYPDQDPDPSKRRGTFIGANDGASGVAVLAELGHHMREIKGEYGVDFVLFDGEEFIFDSRRDPYFLGSTYFARHYVASAPPYRYRWGVLLDMVGDANLNVFQEVNSVRWHDTRPLVKDIWDTARRLGVNEFIHRPYHRVNDDHIPLHNIAKIPTCDIIDFDYGPFGSRQSYWHTEADLPDKCSAESLAKVGWVVLEWLKSIQ